MLSNMIIDNIVMLLALHEIEIFSIEAERDSYSCSSRTWPSGSEAAKCDI